MFGTNVFGGGYLGHGPIGIVVLVLFGHVIVATLVSNQYGYTADDLQPVLVVADGNTSYAVYFQG